MTLTRAAAVLAVDRPSPAAPPGVDANAFRLAMLEDVYEVLAGLAKVEAVLALCPAPQPAAVAVTWPGTPVVPLRRAAGGGVAGADHAAVVAALAQLGDMGYVEAAVVAQDCPDLPGLLVGKLWRALGRSGVAVCPAQDGGLVALAARLPLGEWFAQTGAGLDTPDAVERLRASAPRRADVAVGPGWHRIRLPSDLAQLDPGLEGWDATRASLTGPALRR